MQLSTPNGAAVSSHPLGSAMLETRNVVVLIVACFAAYALYTYWAAGIAEERSTVEGQVASAQAELDELNGRIAAIERGDSDSIVGLFQRGQIADRLLPDNLRSNDFELALPALIDEFGLTNESGIGRQSPQVETAELEYVPLTTQVTGPLEALIGFATAAEDADRLVTADLSAVSRNSTALGAEDIWAGTVRIRLWGVPTLPVMPTTSNTADADSSAATTTAVTADG